MNKLLEILLAGDDTQYEALLKEMHDSQKKSDNRHDE